jgi:hypothetical protein
MKRKTSLLPTRIYSYGAFEPLEGKELLEEQLRLSATYYNVLVKIEHKRRKEIREVEMSHPVLGGLLPTCKILALELDRAEEGSRACHARGGDKTQEETLRAEIISWRKLKAQLWAVMKEARREAKESLTAQKTTVNKTATATIRAARADSGTLYWGTYLKMEESVQQAARMTKPDDFSDRLGPRFRRMDGTGRVVVQIQKGMPVEQMFSGEDLRLRVDPIPVDTYTRRRHHRRLASRTVVHLRAGSNPDRSPKWISAPIILHRPLPPDARILWAWILRRKVGFRFEYRFQIALESTTFFPKTEPVGKGTVAIDLGWRKKADGGLRVGYWRDDFGRYGEILVPQKTVVGLQKVEELKSIRDRVFNITRLCLLGWMIITPHLPDWLLENRKTMVAWRSQGRLAFLTYFWQTHRFPGDEIMLNELLAWNKQDRHLWAWEAHQRDRRINHRDESFKILASQFAKKYSKMILEDLDLRGFGRKAKPEEGMAVEGQNQRYWARVAAPGELREALVYAAEKEGVKIQFSDPAYTTRQCHLCGANYVWDASQAIEHTCENCGETWDQDHNACWNLLASTEVAPEEPDLLDTDNGAGSGGKVVMGLAE